MTLDELTEAMTAEEVEAAIYAVMTARGLKVTGWKVGAVVRTIVTAVAIVGAAASTLQALIAKSGFLDLAEGDWLALLALYVYGEEKDLGSFATGTVTLTNGGAGVYTKAAGEVTFSNAVTGKTYTNISGFTLLAGPATTLDIDIEAVELGTASNASPGDVSNIVTSLPGVTCSNAAAVVGTDADTDPELRAKCRLKLGSFSPAGPGDAYRYAAISAVDADGVSLGVTRVVAYPDGSGGLDVYAATAAGNISGTVGDLATPLGIVDNDIQTLAAPLAITVNTFTATALPIAVTYQLWLRDTVGLSTSAVATQNAAALTSFLAAQPIGGTDKSGGGTGYVYKEQLERVISGLYSEEDFIDLVVTAPAGDTAIPVDEAPTLGTVTPAVNLVST